MDDENITEGQDSEISEFEAVFNTAKDAFNAQEISLEDFITQVRAGLEALEQVSAPAPVEGLGGLGGEAMTLPEPEE